MHLQEVTHPSTPIYMYMYVKSDAHKMWLIHVHVEDYRSLSKFNTAAILTTCVETPTISDRAGNGSTCAGYRLWRKQPEATKSLSQND